MCLSARCVLVCCCAAGTSRELHLACAALPMPVHGHTGSIGPTAPCVLHCTISTLCAVLRCLVLCSALHCVCRAALHLWAVGVVWCVVVWCGVVWRACCGMPWHGVVWFAAASGVGVVWRVRCSAMWCGVIDAWSPYFTL